MSYQRLRAIATQVRRDLECERRRDDWTMTMGYSVKWTLGGLCAEASRRIAGRALSAGIDGVRVVDSSDEGHTFVRWRHWLVDVTATQFNSRRPRVCLVNLVKRRHPLPEYWQEAAS